MVKAFYPKLAFNNLKKNRRIYLPFILTCVFTVAMFYIIKSLSINPDVSKMAGGGKVQYTLNLGTYVTGIFAVIFLFYTHSFIIKRRKKEFGLFNILGLEKRHIGLVLLFETMFIAAISIVMGFVFGIILDKLMLLILAKILKSDFGIGFFVSAKTILSTAVLFVIIFVLIFLWSYLKVRLVQPIELLKGSNAGEKEPKAKWVLALLGSVFLVVGYVLALTAKNGVVALEMFFIAVIFVILGTYLLFTAGSIVLLKILKKNKRYYYKTEHFTSVSGMIYRMKQNAVGLANICILSTMVLVMVATTTSFMFGQKDMLETRYAYEISLTFSGYREENSALIADVNEFTEKENMSIDNDFSVSYLVYTAVLKENDILTSSPNVVDMGSLTQIVYITVDEYNTITKSSVKLGENEILLCDSKTPFPYDTMKVYDREFAIKEHIDEFIPKGVLTMNVIGYLYAVVPSSQVIDEICEYQKKAYGTAASEVKTFYGMDFVDDNAKQINFYNHLRTVLNEKNYNVLLESRASGEANFLGTYGGLFFIGVYLGTIFLMATILIIYYKQISEGYEDKKRFEIMQKVGMSYLEVKKSINSQILTVFFLPLIMAGIHVAFAFPMINKILAVLNLTNTLLFAICALCCFAVFSLVYVIVYLLTGKVYYRIVKNK